MSQALLPKTSFMFWFVASRSSHRNTKQLSSRTLTPQVRQGYFCLCEKTIISECFFIGIFPSISLFLCLQNTTRASRCQSTVTTAASGGWWRRKASNWSCCTKGESAVDLTIEKVTYFESSECTFRSTTAGSLKKKKQEAEIYRKTTVRENNAETCPLRRLSGFLRSDKPIGTAVVKLDKLESRSEIREIVEVRVRTKTDTQLTDDRRFLKLLCRVRWWTAGSTRAVSLKWKCNCGSLWAVRTYRRARSAGWWSTNHRYPPHSPPPVA